jgi:hypothetical protein
MRALLALLVFAASAFAQSSIDPYEFIPKKDFNNADVNQLWRTLGISGKIRETTANGAKDTNDTFSCGPDDLCEAEYLWHRQSRLNGDRDGEDAVIRVSPKDGYGNLNRFVVLHLGEMGWRFVDYLDSTDSRYDDAEALLVNSGGKRWFVVNSYPRCGTGCSLNHSDWFELKNGKFRMVLSVPLSGSEISQNPGRTFETRFVRASQSGGRETLEFVFHAEFNSGFSPVHVNNLWDDEKVIQFSRPIGQGEFKFDSKNSEAPEAFLDIFSTSDEVPQPRIFKVIQNHLLQIASGPHNRRRGWLKELLDQNPTLPALAPVRAALGDQ